MSRTMGDPHISVRGLAHSYGSNGRTTVALESVDLQVERGEFVSVVGPSGGGKTTLLRCIGGLIEPGAGRIDVGGRPAARRSGEIGYVFQDPSLLPWRTVSGNVALPLEIGGGRADPARVDETLDAVGLSGFGAHYPHQLSGGMAQRTAFARALAMDPEVLLMDEPLGALDEITRADMSLYLLSLWERSGSTVVMVTHSVPGGRDDLRPRGRDVQPPRPHRRRRRCPALTPEGAVAGGYSGIPRLLVAGEKPAACGVR